jgi:group I intron endonuclease
MKQNFFVYQITNRVNKKIYIGKSNDQLKNGSTRWQIHIRIAKGGREKYGRSFSVVHRAIRKYGKENFDYEVIQYTDTEIEALDLEQKLIAHMRASGKPAYNVTAGGEGMTGYHHTKNTKQRLSIACRGNNSPRSILTEQDVITIKQSLNDGISRKKLATLYRVSKSTIAMIAQGKRWTHI